MLLKKLKKQKMAIGILGQKIVIYGDNGTGKTTVAIEIGKQLCKQITSNPEAAPLVIGFENGTNASDDFYYVDGTDYDQTREILSDKSSADADIKLAEARLKRALIRQSVADLK